MVRLRRIVYNALEEAVVNAVFHKSYKDDVPVNIRIYTDHIEIINYPGPDKWIDMDKFSKGKIRSRKYRNRRIGEFLKELDLSEKQGTGITKIINSLKLNGSPAVEFETVDERVYLSTIIRLHRGFKVKNETSFETSLKQVLKQVLTEKELSKLEPIIDYIEKYGSITVQQAIDITGKSRTTVWRYMQTLTKTEIIQSAGNTDNTIYKRKE